MEIYRKLIASIEKHEGVSLVTITNVQDGLQSLAHLVGEKAIIWAEGRTYLSTQFSQALLPLIIEHVGEAYRNRESKTYTVSLDGSTVEFYVDVFPPPLRLLIAGAGHVAKPVVQIGKMLGFMITVIDDRPEYATKENFPWAEEIVCKSFIDYFREVETDDNTFILLITRGHKYDVMILPELFNRSVAYIGMIGSRRRISGVFSQLKKEYPQENFENIYAPIGLDIGAQTPEEIAVSVLAELLKIKNNKSGVSLRQKIPFFIAKEKE